MLDSRANISLSLAVRLASMVLQKLGLRSLVFSEVVVHLRPIAQRLSRLRQLKAVTNPIGLLEIGQGSLVVAFMAVHAADIVKAQSLVGFGTQIPRQLQRLIIGLEGLIVIPMVVIERPQVDQVAEQSFPVADLAANLKRCFVTGEGVLGLAQPSLDTRHLTQAQSDTTLISDFLPDLQGLLKVA